jgi:hypothetical protein
MLNFKRNKMSDRFILQPFTGGTIDVTNILDHPELDTKATAAWLVRVMRWYGYDKADCYMQEEMNDRMIFHHVLHIDLVSGPLKELLKTDGLKISHGNDPEQRGGTVR